MWKMPSPHVTEPLVKRIAVGLPLKYVGWGVLRLLPYQDKEPRKNRHDKFLCLSFFVNLAHLHLAFGYEARTFRM